MICCKYLKFREKRVLSGNRLGRVCRAYSMSRKIFAVRRVLKGTFEDFDGFLSGTFRTVCFPYSCLTAFVSVF